MKFNKILTIFFTVSSLLIMSASFAVAYQTDKDSDLVKGPSEAQLAEMAEYNNQWMEEEKELSRSGRYSKTPPAFGFKPFAEYTKTGYLIINDKARFESDHVKIALAKYLPEPVVLIVLSSYPAQEHIDKVRRRFLKYLPENRLKVIYVPNAEKAFWARDAMPFPLVPDNAIEQKGFSVVDARYYKDFYADQEIADYFGASLIRHQCYFEGGNLMVNSQGTAIVINARATARLYDKLFHGWYGVKNLIRLPHIKGIGHADECVKFVSDNVVLTDMEEYVSELQEAGFEVKMLPRLDSNYANYVNSLIIEDTVFVPVFDVPSDQEAIDTYRSLGFKVIPLVTTTLSNKGNGSIHCITMTYPPVPFEQLERALQAPFN